ncbi:ribosome maturation factor RimM [Lamprobacter modestohalophilus]|uniref:Ribosome maturation factor RimM n=1 Tax=Lamprobacter modestohalophilus TaxID=1064514 RepID=A0A9X0W5B7_9GAMM|nr:ribosome maturation factor RimM [Lamprobacter modestohalophilus]MBK1617091.1 ribosome maturation factor RimM [Lamprobacter modestohalophilus]
MTGSAEASDPAAPNKIVLGRILGVYGVRGWLKIFSETSPLENIFSYSPWLIDGDEQQVVTWRNQGKGLVAQLQGYDDRDHARTLTGKAIAIRRDQLPPPSPDEFYWIDLQGLQVETREGVALGQVSHLIETGSNDVMVVRGERERLLPFVWGQFVLDVDFEAGRLLVDWDPEF